MFRFKDEYIRTSEGELWKIEDYKNYGISDIFKIISRE
jgi:hypothetical protein